MSKSTLQELRELNIRKQKERQPEGTPPEPDQARDSMTGHMTDLPDGHIPDNTESYISGNTISRTDSQVDDLPDRKPSRKRSGTAEESRSRGPATVSVRDRIVAAAQAAPPAQAKPILKTVTIKMDPALDRRVEDHCYASGRLKQDVIRDAVLLYFETIEAAQEGG